MSTGTSVRQELPPIQVVDPLQHAAGIRRLFANEGREGFDEYFERCYPTAVRKGALSWIALDSDGRVVMHLARIPHAFVDGPETARGGLIANIMVARSHRTGAPARALFRRVVEDSARDGRVDFLYTETTDRAARAMGDAGFLTAATVHRFVLPIGDEARWKHLAMRLRTLLVGARLDAGGLLLERSPAAQWELEEKAPSGAAGSQIRTRVEASDVAARVPGFPCADDDTLTIRGGNGTTQVGKVLLRRDEKSATATLLRVECETDEALPSMLHRTAIWLHEQGFQRLQVMTIGGSRFARKLQCAGFIAREGTPLVAAAITPLGEKVVNSVDSWAITQVDLDS